MALVLIATIIFTIWLCVGGNPVDEVSRKFWTVEDDDQ